MRSCRTRHSFRQCLPGALVAVVLWTALIVGFRYYLALGFGAPAGVFSNDARITLIGHAVAAVVATAFLFYFASSAVLIGAELNAELIRRARQRVQAPGLARARTTRSWPRALPPSATSLSARLVARRSSNGRSLPAPTPSPGRRVRVVATAASEDGDRKESREADRIRL
jgi:hypothetical protein